MVKINPRKDPAFRCLLIVTLNQEMNKQQGLLVLLRAVTVAWAAGGGVTVPFIGAEI